MNFYDILLAKKLSAGGSPEPVLISKQITANGEYSAADDEADGYSSVSVDVPNSYTAQDEGKVVSSGALISQTSGSTTQNGTVDTTTISSLTVAVEPDLTTKNISANGTYSASDDNADGYSSVVVDVPSDTIRAIVTVLVENGAVVTATGTEGTYTETAGLSDNAVLKIKRHGSYTVSATKNGVTSNTESLTIPEYGGQYTKTLSFITLTVTIPSGSTYTITDGATTITGTSAGSAITHYLPNTGTWTVSCTDGEHSASDTVSISEYMPYSIELTYVVAHIYGVSWDKSSSSVLTRTDDAANFSDPDPYVNDGVHSGSSPFDALMPWAGMVQETIDGNALVKIPKFWYKITNTSSALTIQIADAPKDGFSVSPAHQARNLSENDRDYVYIGRYKCDSSYKSTSISTPKTSITRATARSGITSLGTGYYMQDFAMFWTIRMLYLVEFADWNSQTKIGYGCGDGSSVQKTGYTDNMTYHTGTTQSSRMTYGYSTQYRWIEGLWENVFEWVDGIRFSSSSIYISTDPSTYSDTSGGTSIGSRVSSNGYITGWLVPSGTLDWALYPNSIGGSGLTYVPDYCDYGSSGVDLYVGGCFDQGLNYGFFCLFGSSSASLSHYSIGTRLQYLPS